MKIIAEFIKKNTEVKILRDNYGHWYVQVDNAITQRKLNATEIVRYLANAAHLPLMKQSAEKDF